MKKIIINADDFGMSRVFNEIILNLLAKEFIKSTSVLVTRGLNDQLDQIERLKEIMEQKDISVGLHLESDKNNLAGSVENIKKQNELFVKYFRFKPTHIDKHRDIYSKEEAEAMVDFAVKNDIYIRNVFAGYAPSRGNEVKTSRYVMLLSGESMNRVKDELLNKMEDGEIMEIATHPGKFDPDCESSLNEDREKDYEKIIELASFLKENHIALVNQKI